MTTAAVTTFFTDQSNQAQLRRLVHELRASSSDAIEPKGFSYYLTKILELMLANPEKFDEFASVNIEWIGQGFIGEISNYFNLPEDKRQEILRSIFTSAFRFLCELEFTQPADPSFDVRRISGFVHENLDSFTGVDRQQLVYAAYAMPAQIVKKLISNPAITEFRRFSETVERSRNLREEWDADFEKKKELLVGLAENVSKISSSYNFVGLVHGLQNLRGQKEKERLFSYRSLIAVAACMFVLPIAQLTFVVSNLQTIDAHRTTLAYSLPTILAIEVILLYFFRVVLGQFRSVKAQLLQLDFRISLCQFIESYSEYVSRVRKNDSSALSKFEALVFSGLVAGEADIPSTFDGTEQIASLIRSLRGAGNDGG